jgi:SAM-dependent methyltransferase
MSETDVPPFAPEWLALREDADARARSREPVGLVRGRGRVVADLGCGTGSLGRWLAPRLESPQHWVLFDRDPRLLAVAERAVPGATTETRRCDLAALRAEDLEGCTLVVASALLDVLTRPVVDSLAEAVVGAGCPALFSLTVAGRVELSPADPLDGAVAAAFDAHQRRGGLLGPDAVGAARAAFHERGAVTRVFPSPWRLGPDQGALLAAWLRGWVGAAVEQDPALPGRAYLERRLAECARGTLFAVVHHTDLWADPAGSPE